MGTMRVIGRRGDSRVSWDAEVAAEVEVAKKAFADYKSKGFAAFCVTREGSKGHQITDFAPDAEEIIFVPPIAGGC